eukprot:TRINITY_DN21077_c0_g1_i1.p1 TRINITY_DN21077_c0_g1~~TRINITY_DN21077_c0_g1_i1.p1  ORF type:complete len:791 (+),score=108.74 TRINITY_DN21077_c0_g1_i1:61-2373(+)
MSQRKKQHEGMKGFETPGRYHPYLCHPDLVSVPSERSISYTHARKEKEERCIDTIGDLVTPDGEVISINRSTDRSKMECGVVIENISERWAGWNGNGDVFFSIKATCAQMGIDGQGSCFRYKPREKTVSLVVQLTTISSIGILLLDEIKTGSKIGKLFCRDPFRRINDPEYLERIDGRIDKMGKPIMSYLDYSSKQLDGRVIFYFKTQPGVVEYGSDVINIVPTIGKAITRGVSCRQLVMLHQVHNIDKSRIASPGRVLMVRTQKMFFRNCYARVATDLLPKGISCTSATVLEPEVDPIGGISSHSLVNCKIDGHTFTFYGDSAEFLDAIPFELYSPEPWREHLYFTDGLKTALDTQPKQIFKAFESMPDTKDQSCCYVVSSDQLVHLRSVDWITTSPTKGCYPGIMQPERQRSNVLSYIRQQCSYGILKAISVGDINSHGVLLCRYLPSPVLKNLLLSDTVSVCLKRIYFVTCSQTSGPFLSHEDRSLLYDLSLFGVEVLNVDLVQNKIFEYIHKHGRDHGGFVPVFPNNRTQEYLDATAFGIYGSNLKQGSLEGELEVLFKGLLDLKTTIDHPLMNREKPLALITGGGPGAMEVGNRVAKNCGILSCGNICDFTPKGGGVVNEQKRNPYVDVWMTYKLEKLVERQSDFQLDFPIILTGGIGTDFEHSLEEVRRKVGASPPTPILLFGSPSYFRDKLTQRFTRNLAEGVIKGSEWLSNIFYAVQTGEQALHVYKQYFSGKLVTGPKGKVHSDGFCEVPLEFKDWPEKEE